MNRLHNFLVSERGNVESSLVLIPLLFLFLCSIQVISAIYVRNGEQISVQSDASNRAISGSYLDGDQILEIGNSSSRFGRKILLTHREKSIPILIPGLTSLMGKRVSSSLIGVAVIEND